MMQKSSDDLFHDDETDTRYYKINNNYHEHVEDSEILKNRERMIDAFSLDCKVGDNGCATLERGTLLEHNNRNVLQYNPKGLLAEAIYFPPGLPHATKLRILSGHVNTFKDLEKECTKNIKKMWGWSRSHNCWGLLSEW